jgi:hypothetical protein
MSDVEKLPGYLAKQIVWNILEQVSTGWNRLARHCHRCRP